MEVRPASRGGAEDEGRCSRHAPGGPRLASGSSPHGHTLFLASNAGEGRGWPGTSGWSRSSAFEGWLSIAQLSRVANSIVPSTGASGQLVHGCESTTA
jgi:hypothetical protein